MRRWFVAALLLTACEPLILIAPPVVEVDDRDAGRPVPEGCGRIEVSVAQPTTSSVAAMFAYDGATYAIDDTQRWLRIDPGLDGQVVTSPTGFDRIVEVYDASLISGERVWLSARDDEGGVLVLVDLANNVVTKRVTLGNLTLGAIAGTADGTSVFGTGRKESGGNAWEIRDEVPRSIPFVARPAGHNIARGAAVYVERDGAYLVPTNQDDPACVLHVTLGGPECVSVTAAVAGDPYALTLIDGEVHIGTTKGWVVPIAEQSEGKMSGLSNQSFGGWTCDNKIDNYETVQALAPTALGGYFALNCRYATEQTPMDPSCQKFEITPALLTNVRAIAVEAPDTYLVGGAGGVRRLRIQRQ